MASVLRSQGKGPSHSWLKNAHSQEQLPVQREKGQPPLLPRCQKAHRAPTYMLNVPVTLQLVRDVPGSVDKNGICHCVAYLPSNLIPLKQLEQLLSTAQELMDKYEQELSRVSAGAGAGSRSGTGSSMRMSSGGKEGADGNTALIFEENP